LSFIHCLYFRRPAGVYRRSLPITQLLFLSSTCQPRICPTRGDLIPSCLPLIPCRALVDSFLTKRESILGVCGLAAKADLINGARQGQAMGLLRLHNSRFALVYPHHALPLLTYAYTTAPVSRDRRLPFSQTGIVMGHGTRDNVEKELPSEGIVTWSVLLIIISVVYPHTFNSGHAYLLDPGRRSCRSELLFRFMEVSYARPQSPRYFCLNIHLAVLRLTGTQERLFRKATSKVSEGVWFGKTTPSICSHASQWFLVKSPHHLVE